MLSSRVLPKVSKLNFWSSYYNPSSSNFSESSLMVARLLSLIWGPRKVKGSSPYIARPDSSCFYSSRLLACCLTAKKYFTSCALIGSQFICLPRQWRSSTPCFLSSLLYRFAITCWNISTIYSSDSMRLPDTSVGGFLSSITIVFLRSGPSLFYYCLRITFVVRRSKAIESYPTTVWIGSSINSSSSSISVASDEVRELATEADSESSFSLYRYLRVFCALSIWMIVCDLKVMKPTDCDLF